MGKQKKIEILDSLNRYITDIVDERIMYKSDLNHQNSIKRKSSHLKSEPVDIAVPFGWHPEKTEKLLILHNYLFKFGIIICNYIALECHFIGLSKEKIMWFGTRTELIFLIIQIVEDLKLIPKPAKNNLNVVISQHFRTPEGDIDPSTLKAVKTKGIGADDRLDVFNTIIIALKK